MRSIFCFLGFLLLLGCNKSNSEENKTVSENGSESAALEATALKKMGEVSDLSSDNNSVVPKELSCPMGLGPKNIGMLYLGMTRKDVEMGKVKSTFAGDSREGDSVRMIEKSPFNHQYFLIEEIFHVRFSPDGRMESISIDLKKAPRVCLQIDGKPIKGKDAKTVASQFGDCRFVHGVGASVYKCAGGAISILDSEDEFFLGIESP